MTELDKLKFLLKHWVEHNNAHIDKYAEGAAIAKFYGKDELYDILNQIVEDSKKLNGLFNKAIEVTK